MTLLAPTLQAFFTTYLAGQKAASSHTIAAYRDTWRLLLTFLAKHHQLRPATTRIEDLDAGSIIEFLAYLEDTRNNTASSRNARLAGIHSFFHYAAFRYPEHADLIARVLAIAPKNTTTPDVNYLNDAEATALLGAPNQHKWTGRRDKLMIQTLLETGLRVSELTTLTWDDIQLHTPAYISCRGKGRKDRSTPLTPGLAQDLTSWQQENVVLATASPVFTAQGSHRPMSADAVTQRLATHQLAAAKTCPSLHSKTITPHILRHTTAMRMLAAGIDITTIALWLGHASTESTNAYLHADLAIKQRALDRTTPLAGMTGRYKPPDSLLNFLENL